MSADDLFDERLGAFGDAPATYEAEERRLAKAKRHGGRPPGAPNKKTEAFEKFYHAHGYKDPLVAMAEFLTVDPVQLLAWFRRHDKKGAPTLFQLVQQQSFIADRIAPYLHGKMPIKVEIIGDRLPVFVLNLDQNQLEQARRLQHQGRFAIGAPVIDQDAEAPAK